MAIEGSLAEFRLPDILQMVAQQRKTGILTIQGESTIVAVSFLDGRVVAADSLEETVEERLGDVLVEEGLLDHDTFSEVSQRQRQGEGRLVDLLVDGGYLSRQQVLATLRRQTEGLLRLLLDWEEGEFKFYGNDEVSYEEGFDPIRVDDLLISALSEADAEPGAEPTEDAAAAATSFPRAVPDAAPGEEPADEAASFTAAGESFTAANASFTAADEVEEGGGVLQMGTTTEVAVAETDVFTPVETPGRPVLVRPAARRAGTAPPALVSLLAAALAAAVLAALLLVPSRFLLPLPWQSGERLAYQVVARQATYQVIDRSAKTFFLIEGRFPDDLSRLVDLSLLAPWELRDPSGAALRYTPVEDSYELAPAPQEGGEVDEGAASLEAITGNFLLDPEFLTHVEEGGRAPLVLLD